ncbi:MAG TPA: 4Fe-4S dicluster domain-containing protein [Anaerolineales bacterium]|nr:4Fe-4S dicluster domain-containing protein [Anaerolineae bacterium]HIQ00656.1 4Fe-4S dicluster domain-containing protein [Anaerolineales bacterium]
MYASLYVLKAFGVTLRRFVESYVDDLKWFLKGGFGKRYTPDALAVRQSPKGRGIFTVQYPAERLPLPERFRGFPFLVYDDETGKPLCTACGTCARVCPPQCIWIVRASHPETGKPLREPAEFHIDISICMNCGFCAEFCPFDAIKMGQEIEIATFERDGTLLWNQEKLLRPLSYHAQIHPTDYAQEQAKRKPKKKKA